MLLPSLGNTFFIRQTAEKDAEAHSYVRESKTGLVAPGRAGTAAASSRLCSGRPRLRCRGNPIRVANSRHPAAVGDAPHQARQRFGNLALGRRADICLAQSVSTAPCPLRQAGRHPRSVPLARLCADLLAVVAQDLEDRLSRSAFSSSIARSPFQTLQRGAPLGWLKSACSLSS